jgi:hypothetical protein
MSTTRVASLAGISPTVPPSDRAEIVDPLLKLSRHGACWVVDHMLIDNVWMTGNPKVLMSIDSLTPTHV